MSAGCNLGVVFSNTGTKIRDFALRLKERGSYLQIVLGALIACIRR
jgi:hypothetical protein